MTFILFLSVLLLAFSNGANDTFKGVATLWASNTTDYDKALQWSVVFTLAGSVCSYFFASLVLKNIAELGVVPDRVFQDVRFIAAIALSSGLTIFIASLRGYPVSTTHTLLGAMVGAGYLAAGDDLYLSSLLKHFFLPLLLSPLLSVSLTFIVMQFLHLIPAWKPAETHILDEKDKKGLVNGLHYLSAALLSFMRGLGDMPKLTALLILFPFIPPFFTILLLTLLMGLGGLFGSFPVAARISKNITPMTPVQGLVANSVSCGLALLSAAQGLPVSINYISIGSIFGIGFIEESANKKEVFNIIICWCLTLPVAFAFSFFIYFALTLTS